jgi:hypothetical protein
MNYNLVEEQKWVCIKPFEVEDIEFDDPIGQYNIGDIVTVDKILEE